MPYTDADLREKRLYYLKACKPHDLRQLRQDRQLDSHLDRKVSRCREQAEDLIESGVFAGQAWQWAIREILLETEAD